MRLVDVISLISGDYTKTRENNKSLKKRHNMLLALSNRDRKKRLLDI
jgi:hypothetical protein